MSKIKHLTEVLTYQYYDTDDKGNKINMGIKPVFQTKGAACADVAIPKEIHLVPNECAKIDLMIGFDIPEGYKILMYPRSSLLVKHGLMSPVSVIDWDFKVAKVSWPVWNCSNKCVKLEAGTRVAQVELVPMGVEPVDWIRKDVVRDLNGFGETGDK